MNNWIPMIRAPTNKGVSFYFNNLRLYFNDYIKDFIMLRESTPPPWLEPKDLDSSMYYPKIPFFKCRP